MTGQAITVGGDLSGFGAQYVSIDKRLTPGSLILTDFTHSFNASGVPAHNDKVYNLAWNEAAGVIGAGTEESLKSTFLNTFVGAEGAFERTSKGALYGVVSKTDQGDHQARIEGPQPVIDYLFADPTTEIACFIWADIKRVSNTNSNMIDSGIGNTASWGGNNLINIPFANTLGPQRFAGQRTSWSAGGPSENDTFNKLYQLAWGNLPPYNSTVPDDGKSMVLYQYHLIDVAASGFTYAELAAQDAANYASFFGAGGAYSGDTVSLVLGDYP